MANKIINSVIALVVASLTLYMLFFFEEFTIGDADRKPSIGFIIIAVLLSLALLVYMLRKIWKVDLSK